MDEEREGMTGLWERQEPGEAKGTRVFPDFLAPLVIVARRARGGASASMAQKETRALQVMKERQEIWASWAIKEKRERKDRRAHRERRGTKDRRAAEVSRAKRAKMANRALAACRATWGYRACRGHRGRREKDQQIHTSNKSA